MPSIRAAFVLVLILGIFLEQASLTAQDWDRANAATVRLKPATFAELPGAVRQDLERRGCEVPQAYSKKAPHNVIRGRFTSLSQTDIAVLCSKARISTILVFRGESTSAVAELATRPDQDFLQVVASGNVVGYSRILDVANPRYIKKHYVEEGGSKLPPLDHDGINDIFIEKGSVVWFWRDGRWLELHGPE